MSKIVYCKSMPEINPDKTVILDGKEIFDFPTLFDVLWESLSFPESKYKNWDAYLDWMRDLTWLKEKTIGIIIVNPDMFLKNEPNGLMEFVKDYEFPIIPYWNSIEEVDAENAKDIVLYCVTSE